MRDAARELRIELPPGHLLLWDDSAYLEPVGAGVHVHAHRDPDGGWRATVVVH